MTRHAMEPANNGAPRLIRPFMVTRGRTRSKSERFEIETQLQATGSEEAESQYRWETAAVLAAARQPSALAEIAARSDLTIGVARVLVGDLVADGVMQVHKTDAGSSMFSISLLEEVLDGLNNL